LSCPANQKEGIYVDCILGYCGGFYGGAFSAVDGDHQHQILIVPRFDELFEALLGFDHCIHSA
jgi:hypothetical protein